jgi:hypothetical protein
MQDGVLTCAVLRSFSFTYYTTNNDGKIEYLTIKKMIKYGAYQTVKKISKTVV